MSVATCQVCDRPVEAGYALCPACELDFALLLLQFVPWTHALEASLDATLHPGGHQPTRIITPVAPTPLRLDVLDHLDLLASIVQGLWRRLTGVDILDWKRDLCPDIIGCLTDAAMHPDLAMIPDIGMYVSQFQRLKPKTLAIIDPPDRATPIGQCLTCGLTGRRNRHLPRLRQGTDGERRAPRSSGAQHSQRQIVYGGGVRATVAVVRVSDQPQDHHLMEVARADRAMRRG